jgi:predicted nuclease of predicted toxin-antitoxin system
MKRLFAENLSPQLPGLVARLFARRKRVRHCGRKVFSDEEVWNHAR